MRSRLTKKQIRDGIDELMPQVLAGMRRLLAWNQEQEERLATLTKMVNQLPAVYLGDGTVRIGTGDLVVDRITLGDAQAVVLEALLDAGGACFLEELQSRSGLPWAAERFRKLAEHPVLGSYFTRPLEKGNGGYRTSIRDGRVSCAE